MVCDLALADFFSDVAPVCLIIASIVLLITVYRLTVANSVDCEGAKAKRNFLSAYPENVSGPRCCHSPTSFGARGSSPSRTDGIVDLGIICRSMASIVLLICFSHG